MKMKLFLDLIFHQIDAGAEPIADGVAANAVLAGFGTGPVERSGG
jgi:hypothetical protein